MVFITTQEPETERRLLLSAKSNLGALPKGLGYRMEQRIVSKGIVGSHIVWDNAPVTITADEAIRQSGSHTSKTAEAKEFLRDYLSAGSVAADTVTAAAEREGISGGTLRRARKELGIVPKKSGYQGQWVWELPESPSTDNVIPIKGAHR